MTIDDPAATRTRWWIAAVCAALVAIGVLTWRSWDPADRRVVAVHPIDGSSAVVLMRANPDIYDASCRLGRVDVERNDWVWEVDLPDGVECHGIPTPLAAADDLVLVRESGPSGRLLGFDAGTGEQRWATKVGEPEYARVSVVGDRALTTSTPERGHWVDLASGNVLSTLAGFDARRYALTEDWLSFDSRETYDGMMVRLDDLELFELERFIGSAGCVHDGMLYRLGVEGLLRFDPSSGESTTVHPLPLLGGHPRTADSAWSCGTLDDRLVFGVDNRAREAFVALDVPKGGRAQVAWYTELGRVTIGSHHLDFNLAAQPHVGELLPFVLLNVRPDDSKFEWLVLLDVRTGELTWPEDGFDDRGRRLWRVGDLQYVYGEKAPGSRHYLAAIDGRTGARFGPVLGEDFSVAPESCDEQSVWLWTAEQSSPQGAILHRLDPHLDVAGSFQPSQAPQPSSELNSFFPDGGNARLPMTLSSGR